MQVGAHGPDAAAIAERGDLPGERGGAVLTEAIAQVPDPQRRDLLITVDGAGATLELIRHISGLNAVHGGLVHYSVGFDLDARARAAIGLIRERDWQHVWDATATPARSTASTARCRGADGTALIAPLKRALATYPFVTRHVGLEDGCGTVRTISDALAHHAGIDVNDQFA